MSILPKCISSRLEILMLLFMLPLLGIILAEKPLHQYLEFPPKSHYVVHEGFSWPAFTLLALCILAGVIPFLLLAFKKPAKEEPTPDKKHTPTRRFPWWGWVGLFLGALCWLLAWTRIPWFQNVQPFTFTPIWLCYIVVINALLFKRTGRCMLVNRPLFMGGLFILSAGFWWYFEYLNRFVQNWFYQGVDNLSPWSYFLFATFPFSTVLPAVLCTFELLQQGTKHGSRLDHFIPLRMTHPEVVAWPVAVFSGVGLLCIGLWPDYLFPLLWVSPLFLITSIQCIRKEQTLFSSLREGKWRDLYLLAIAALLCGFFWELWNVYSLAKWTYSVPFVQRYHLFEMPILGYAGYLPFGMECAVIVHLFFGPRILRPTKVPASLEGNSTLVKRCKLFNTAIGVGLMLYFFIIPGFLVMRDTSPKYLADPGIHPRAWALHKDMTQRYGDWARNRVADGKAGHLDLYDVPSTEWPLFGSVFYLWGTVALQEAWDSSPENADTPPKEYARETIEAAIELIMDPVHHTWVKTHWGEDYLHTENVFFRTLLISGMTSYQSLTGNQRYQAELIDQIDSLSAELDASPHGLLEDYPTECYPVDILAAIACIQRADILLGTDHSAFIQRAKRAFEGSLLDERGLIPYRVNARTGFHFQPSRGIGNSYVLLFTRELWDNQADTWYDLYVDHFWQDKGWATGFREFPRDLKGHEFGFDVDAGPILGGFSPAANAFGWAAAKINGRMDHAQTLGAQVLSACWPLPNGSLLGPQLLSDPLHAPYLGEACLLFFLTQTPGDNVPLVTGSPLKHGNLFNYGLYFMLGGLGLLLVGIHYWRWTRRAPFVVVNHPVLQGITWSTLLLAACILTCVGYVKTGLLVLIFALRLPRAHKVKPTGTVQEAHRCA